MYVFILDPTSGLCTRSHNAYSMTPSRPLWLPTYQ